MGDPTGSPCAVIFDFLIFFVFLLLLPGSIGYDVSDVFDHEFDILITSRLVSIWSKRSE